LIAESKKLGSIDKLAMLLEQGKREQGEED